MHVSRNARAVGYSTAVLCCRRVALYLLLISLLRSLICVCKGLLSFINFHNLLSLAARVRDTSIQFALVSLLLLLRCTVHHIYSYSFSYCTVHLRVPSRLHALALSPASHSLSVAALFSSRGTRDPSDRRTLLAESILLCFEVVLET